MFHLENERYRMKDIKVIGFDADDTLWVNETYYRETENEFAKLMSEYLPEDEVHKQLFSTEMQNLRMYGYGTKGFMLSLIESAIKISKGEVSNDVLSEIIEMGKSMLQKPIELLPGVQEVLEQLSDDYTLIVVTKGDLVNQEQKLDRSGLMNYFDRIEILSDKKEMNYQGILNSLNIYPDEFAMVGNSIRSDIKPVLNLGCTAVHIPFHTTWVHEESNTDNLISERFIELKTIKGMLANF